MPANHDPLELTRVVDAYTRVLGGYFNKEIEESKELIDFVDRKRDE